MNARLQCSLVVNLPTTRQNANASVEMIIREPIYPEPLWYKDAADKMTSLYNKPPLDGTTSYVE